MADTTVLVMMVGSWVLYAVVSKIRGHRSSDDRDDPCRSHPGVVVGPILFISYSVYLVGGLLAKALLHEPPATLQWMLQSSLVFVVIFSTIFAMGATSMMTGTILGIHVGWPDRDAVARLEELEATDDSNQAEIEHLIRGVWVRARCHRSRKSREILDAITRRSDRVGSVAKDVLVGLEERYRMADADRGRSSLSIADVVWLASLLVLLTASASLALLP